MAFRLNKTWVSMSCCAEAASAVANVDLKRGVDVRNLVWSVSNRLVAARGTHHGVVM